MPKNLYNSKKILFISVAIVIMVFCAIVAYLLSSIIVPANKGSENISSSQFNLYMISLSKSQVENESLSRRADFQMIGAGGYVWKDEQYYHVISSAYIEKNDAVLVQNSIKLNFNLDSELITVPFPSFTLYGSFSSEEKKTLMKAVDSIYQYYLSVFDIAVSLDTGVYNEISARLAINNAHSVLANIIDDYNTLFGDVESDELTTLKEMLADALSISTKLCGGEKINQGQSYSSILKYRYLEMLNLYYNFAS